MTSTRINQRKRRKTAPVSARLHALAITHPTTHATVTAVQRLVLALTRR